MADSYLLSQFFRDPVISRLGLLGEGKVRKIIPAKSGRDLIF